MKCPLLLPGSLHQLTKNRQEPMDCLQEECAWWDKAYNRCAVLSIGVGLDFVDKRLLDLHYTIDNRGIK